MPSTPRSEQRRFPLHVHISVMFTFLLLLTGIVLGFFNYQQTTRIILSSSEHLFQRIEQDVQQDLKHTYQPIRYLLSLQADNPAIQAPDLNRRLALLKPFSQSLIDHGELASLYVGYANGDFFMVRPLRSAALKAARKAPEAAAYEVWSIEHAPGGEQVRSQTLFYDSALGLLDQRSNSNERYDPRTRAWFANAPRDDEQITTAPYVFFSTRNVGTTLARRSGDSAVIGADLTLEQLSG